MFLALQTWLRATSNLGVQNNKLKKPKPKTQQYPSIPLPRKQNQKPQSSDYSDTLE